MSESGFLVVLRPYDDLKLLPDIWLVHGLDTKQRRERFASVFDSAKAEAARKNPDEWTIDDVRRILAKKFHITVQEEAVALTY